MRIIRAADAWKYDHRPSIILYYIIIYYIILYYIILYYIILYYIILSFHKDLSSFSNK